MCSRFLSRILLLAAALAASGCARHARTVTASSAPAKSERVLHVVADPNNLPFSNDKLEGFENRLAELIARDMGAKVEYAWRAQRRGFFRHAFQDDGGTWCSACRRTSSGR